MKYRSVEMCLIKPKAALHRGIDLSLSGFTASSTWRLLEENFYSNSPPPKTFSELEVPYVTHATSTKVKTLHSTNNPTSDNVKSLNILIL